jgi:hypothetical protein
MLLIVAAALSLAHSPLDPAMPVEQGVVELRAGANAVTLMDMTTSLNAVVPMVGARFSPLRDFQLAVPGFVSWRFLPSEAGSSVPSLIASVGIQGVGVATSGELVASSRVNVIASWLSSTTTAFARASLHAAVPQDPLTEFSIALSTDLGGLHQLSEDVAIGLAAFVEIGPPRPDRRVSVGIGARPFDVDLRVPLIAIRLRYGFGVEGWSYFTAADRGVLFEAAAGAALTWGSQYSTGSG